MRRLFENRTMRFLAVLVAAACLAGGAFAYWTASGTGSGTATVAAGSAQDLTFEPGTASAGLFPGGTGDVDILVHNPNSFAVHLNGLVLMTTEGTGGFAVATGDSSCDLGKLNFPLAQTNLGLGWEVPANAAAYEIHLADGAISLDTDAPNSCQGDTFRVYLQAAS